MFNIFINKKYGLKKLKFLNKVRLTSKNGLYQLWDSGILNENGGWWDD